MLTSLFDFYILKQNKDGYNKLPTGFVSSNAPPLKILQSKMPPTSQIIN